MLSHASFARGEPSEDHIIIHVQSMTSGAFLIERWNAPGNAPKCFFLLEMNTEGQIWPEFIMSNSITHYTEHLDERHGRNLRENNLAHGTIYADKHDKEISWMLHQYILVTKTSSYVSLDFFYLYYLFYPHRIVFILYWINFLVLKKAKRICLSLHQLFTETRHQSNWSSVSHLQTSKGGIWWLHQKLQEDANAMWRRKSVKRSHIYHISSSKLTACMARERKT